MRIEASKLIISIVILNIKWLNRSLKRKTFSEWMKLKTQWNQWGPYLFTMETASLCELITEQMIISHGVNSSQYNELFCKIMILLVRDVYYLCRIALLYYCYISMYIWFHMAVSIYIVHFADDLRVFKDTLIFMCLVSYGKHASPELSLNFALTHVPCVTIYSVMETLLPHLKLVSHMSMRHFI